MKELNWKVLASQQLFKDTWCSIRKDVCETPAGKKIDPYYVYEFPDWVTAVAVTEDNKIILEKQYRHALGVTLLEIPGGCVDDSDPNLEAAIRRELLEETGYSFSSVELLGITSANPSTNNNRMYMYLARGGIKTKEQQLDHGEEIEISLHSVDEVKQWLKENKFLQSMHTTALFYALYKMGELQF
jgi:8-oxo-dGTP pyrophosphatase MutT (NUDIX family)